jgi:hypothetical protein
MLRLETTVETMVFRFVGKRDHALFSCLIFKYWSIARDATALNFQFANGRLVAAGGATYNGGSADYRPTTSRVRMLAWVLWKPRGTKSDYEAKRTARVRGGTAKARATVIWYESPSSLAQIHHTLAKSTVDHTWIRHHGVSHA